MLNRKWLVNGESKEKVLSYSILAKYQNKNRIQLVCIQNEPPTCLTKTPHFFSILKPQIRHTHCGVCLYSPKDRFRDLLTGWLAFFIYVKTNAVSDYTPELLFSWLGWFEVRGSYFCFQPHLAWTGVAQQNYLERRLVLHKYTISNFFGFFIFKNHKCKSITTSELLFSTLENINRYPFALKTV